MDSKGDQKPGATNKFTVSLDYRILSVVLAVIVVGMLALWRPWENPHANDRTIEVTGSATLTAVPDEFVFTPSYQFKDADKQIAISGMSKKSDEIVKKLKELGVPDNKIKTNSSGYDIPSYTDDKTTPTYTLSLTITATSKDLAQKVEDYLVTTSPTGAVSPQANFSDAKRKTLENQARDEATKDARSKAEQSAKNLGFGLGSIKTVTDGTGFGGIIYPLRGGFATDSVVPSTEKLSVQPGENDLNYTVTVIYFVR
jgi:uncharacterized protein YggE